MVKFFWSMCLFFLVWNLTPVWGGEASGNPDPSQKQKTGQTNPDFFVSVRKALDHYHPGTKTVFIDVRHISSFEGFRIPGSLNLPLFAVKTKTIFKNSPVLLLNEGYDTLPLVRECLRLREKGFQVSILHGGLHAWKNSKGPLIGDPFQMNRLNRMPAGTWFSERQNNRWVPVDASMNQSEKSRSLVPEAVHIPYPGKTESFGQKIRNIMDKNAKDPFYALLVFTEDGKSYHQIEQSLDDISALFFLDGGLLAYEQFLRTRDLMQNREQIKPTKKCRHCS